MPIISRTVLVLYLLAMRREQKKALISFHLHVTPYHHVWQHVTTLKAALSKPPNGYGLKLWVAKGHYVINLCKRLSSSKLLSLTGELLKTGEREIRINLCTAL